VKVLVQAVKRNRDRFPDDFMFQLTREEFDHLKSHLVASSSAGSLRSQFVTLKRGRHTKYLPYAFTEQGVAMLSSVLRSERAVQVNVAIMRAFVSLRRMLAGNEALARVRSAISTRSKSPATASWMRCSPPTRWGGRGKSWCSNRELGRQPDGRQIRIQCGFRGVSLGLLVH
jgi:hypothetical protein